ncbi:hypothetical protein Ddc_11679 [Ditylenchus destructor]|nr:hypothetical protein Ddc_11679 [Ditylenchus destructor]
MDNSGTARAVLVSPNHAAREEAEDGNDEAMEDEQAPEPESSLAKIAAQNAQGIQADYPSIIHLGPLYLRIPIACRTSYSLMKSTTRWHFKMIVGKSPIENTFLSVLILLHGIFLHYYVVRNEYAIFLSN